MLIPFIQPLDLPSTLESGQVFRWKREEPDRGPTDGQWYRGVVFDNVVRIRHATRGVEFYCAPDDEALLKPLLWDYLRLGDDLESIYQTINLDERIDSAIGRYRGLRLVRQDPWECLVSFICSLTNNVLRISANVEAISADLGNKVAMGHHVRNTFPTPSALAAAGEQRLRDLGLGFRAKYISAVAEIVAAGKLDLFALREASYEDALEVLTALPGVADKVANCVLLFSLDKLEAFPVDRWICRALLDWYAGSSKTNHKLSDAKMKIFMRLWAQDYFKPYAGYANQYLFHNRRLMGRRTGSGSS